MWRYNLQLGCRRFAVTFLVEVEYTMGVLVQLLDYLRRYEAIAYELLHRTLGYPLRFLHVTLATRELLDEIRVGKIYCSCLRSSYRHRVTLLRLRWQPTVRWNSMCRLMLPHRNLRSKSLNVCSVSLNVCSKTLNVRSVSWNGHLYYYQDIYVCVFNDAVLIRFFSATTMPRKSLLCRISMR